MDFKWIDKIKNAKKTTMIKLWVQEKIITDSCLCFVGENHTCLIGEQAIIEKFVKTNKLTSLYKECSTRNSAIELLDVSHLKARIEPGSVIRQEVEIEENAIILMGAIINIGAHIGKNTMIDMNAVIGSRAWIDHDCHIGAGAVISGVLEPISATPVIIEDHVLVGANATILEGVHVHRYAVVAAGSVVVKDVEEGMVVAGVPAKVIKARKEVKGEKIDSVEALRNIDAD